jgi:hypothetical protein
MYLFKQTLRMNDLYVIFIPRFSQLNGLKDRTRTLDYLTF